ncbi:hypothetical protein LX99_04244 [Mucilaginibacter oryzae]|uniref:Uncharacterized protein n=1 Tax=Mucilaginibacter oryzae TaxID=468058 RepID=A0A316H427_9SPHI|nr:hypothetical protein [Mucilaginibacter oryzae]PWK72914.1 hypothetical protein LX99_04244 [Mucilaginibacter oryzae]
MPNTICLQGPAFSLTGNASFPSRSTSFALSFDSAEDQQTVLAYEWYLDGQIVTGAEAASLEGKISCGNHTVGARILTEAGWSGIKYLSFSTCQAASMTITGPATVTGGGSAEYHIIATLYDDSTVDLTADYTFTATDGTFNGATYTPGFNDTGLASRPDTITATGPSGTLHKSITILDPVLVPGVLVVDLFSNTGLNVIGLVDNAEVSGNHVAAYTGNNIVPAASNPANALVLASDLIDQETLNWRFEFNIEKLLADHPASPSFTFYIKGRSTAAQTLTGAFSLKNAASEMVLSGSAGSYIPGVTGGAAFSSTVNFSSELVAGANGSHNEADLTTIIRLVYDVATRTVSYTTRGPVQLQDFDYMTVRYHWDQGAGTDLDILVGFENNGTTIDNHYVGFGQDSITIPANADPQDQAYLWWALDNRGDSGYEAALIGMKKFVEDFPAAPGTIEVGIYAVWYHPPGTGNFTVQLNTYKGGQITQSGNDFVYTGGNAVFSDTYPVSTQINNNLHSPASAYKVGVLKYNKATLSALIDIN